MARWAYNNPQITCPVLRNKITKLVAARAKDVIANVLQKRNTNADDTLLTLSMGKKKGKGSN